MPFDRLDTPASKIALEVDVLRVSKHEWFTFTGGGNFITNQTRQQKLPDYYKVRSFWHCLLEPPNQHSRADATGLLQEVTEFLRTCGVTKLPERFSLDLADSLAGNTELTPDFF